MLINIKDFFKLILSFLVCVTRHAQITQNNKFAISLKYLKKEVMKLIFCMQICMKVSYKLILWFLMGMIKYSQSSQNSMFVMFLQYLKKEVRDEVDFLHVDKHQSFLQVDFNILSTKVFCKLILSLLMGMIKHSQSTQRNKLAIIKLFNKNLIKFYTCNKIF